jgi:cytochrome c oxidase cbb3-type subunit III
LGTILAKLRMAFHEELTWTTAFGGRQLRYLQNMTIYCSRLFSRLPFVRATGLIALSLLFTLGGIHSTASAAKAKEPTISHDGRVNAAALYHNYCSVCHGDKGDGRSRAQGSLTPPPKDFTTQAAAALTRTAMIDAVANGRPGTAMTPWKTQLGSKEIEAVVDYVRDTFMPASIANEGTRGRVVFNKNCSVCHGDKGDGRSRAQFSLNPPPRDFTSPQAKTELTYDRMIKSVTYGRADTAMTGFKTQLDQADIVAVVNYIRSSIMGMNATDGISGTSSGTRPGKPGVTVQEKRPADKIKTVNMAAPMPQGLKGDAAKGAAFYMGNCSTCHGATGDGRGPRAYFINPKPRNLIHPATRVEFNRIAIFNAINEGKLGTEMPAWGKVMTPQEIADVAEFVFQRFILSPVADKQTNKQ